MTTDILRRRIIVYPLVAGPDYQGNSGDDAVAYHTVPLTSQYLSTRGGSAFRNGDTWQIRLALVYVDSSGDNQPIDLSGASTLLMAVWNSATDEWVTSRTQDALITGSLYELAIDGDGTAGTLTIAWHQDETVTAGVHEFAILADWTYSEPIASGKLEVLAAIPAES